MKCHRVPSPTTIDEEFLDIDSLEGVVEIMKEMKILVLVEVASTIVVV